MKKKKITYLINTEVLEVECCALNEFFARRKISSGEAELICDTLISSNKAETAIRIMKKLMMENE